MSLSRALLAILALLALWGCGASPTAAPRVTQAPAVSPTERPTRGPAAGATVQTPCAFMWAYQDAPGVPERAERELRDAGISPDQVSARVFGESCGAAFLAMGTRVEVDVTVASLADLDALAGLVVKAIGALERIGETPGLQRELRLTFIAAGERTTLTTNEAQVRRAVDAGLSGGALLEEIGYQP